MLKKGGLAMRFLKLSDILFGIAAFRGKGGLLVLVFASLLPRLHAQESLSFEKAILYAIANNTEIEIKRQAVAEARGNLRSITGRTDFILGSSVSYNHDMTPYDETNTATSLLQADRTDSVTGSVWLEKVFAFGLSVKPSLSYTGKNYQGKFQDDWSDYKTTNYGTVALELSLPLTKAFKSSAIANSIDSYSALLGQSEFELRNQVSAIVVKTAEAYWNYLAANKKLDHYRAAEARMSGLLEDIKKLVAANERPQSDLEQMQANLSSYQVNRIIAEQKLTAAKNSLAVAMGVPFAEFAMLGKPADDFPEDVMRSAPVLNKTKYIELALRNRPDLLALKQKAEAMKIQARMAEINTRPDLKLAFSLGYKGFYYGDNYGKALTDSFSKNVQGADFGGSLVFSMGLPDNTKQGSLEATLAQYNQVVLYVANQEKLISSDTSLQTDLVAGYYTTMTNARQATEFFKKAVESEFKKLRAGLTTVEGLVSIQDRQMDASIQYVETTTQFLSAIIELKNATGTLVDLTDKEKDQLRALHRLPDGEKAAK